ncbi:MAG: NAD(P)-dependent oxidoreductase [Polyangiaceae bacterium]
MKGRRVALVGGAGFIGHNLALKLKSMGADVSVIDGLEVNNLLYFSGRGSEGANTRFYRRVLSERLRLLEDANVPLYVQDARDYHALSKVLSQINPQVIVQLAAVSHANRSNKDPYTTFDHSLRTLENALDYARGKAEHFVYFSSSMVYGNFKTESVTEDAVCEPLGIYGALKYAGEKLVIAYQQTFDLPYTIIRPSALYGERCVSRRVGQVFIENALHHQPVFVNGTGEDRLDFTYIDDLVHGITRVIEHPKSRNEIFNVTYGSSRSIADLAQALQKRFPEVKIEYKEREALMPERGTLCVDKAKELIGYNPSNPLEVGYDKYIDWYQSFYTQKAT